MSLGTIILIILVIALLESVAVLFTALATTAVAVLVS